MFWMLAKSKSSTESQRTALRAELQSGECCVVKSYPLLLWSRDCGRGGIRTGLSGWALGV